MKPAMTGKSMALMLLAGVTILALAMLACMDTNLLMHVHGSSFLLPANGRRLHDTTADVMPRQLQDGTQYGTQSYSMGGIGDVVSFFENNIMLLWLLVTILGCFGCHTVAHYMSVALTGLSYMDLCLGRRPMMAPGMGGMGGMGGNPMGGMGGYPMGGAGGGGMGGMGGMGGGHPMGHGGFNAQPVHHAAYGPAGRQPDGSWKF